MAVHNPNNMPLPYMWEQYEAGKAAWHSGKSSTDCSHVDWISKAFWKYGWLEAQREWYEAHDRDR